MAPPRAEVRQAQIVELPQPLDLGPELGFGARIKHVERKSALSLRHLARAQFVENGERRNFPHRGMRPRP